MEEILAQLQQQIDTVGHEMERKKIALDVSSVDDVNSLAPSGPGIYWIETTMPKDTLASAIYALTGKKRETRKTKPDGVGLIEQNGDAFYVLISNDVQPTESPAEAAAHRWRQPRAVACEARADRIGG